MYLFFDKIVIDEFDDELVRTLDFTVQESDEFECNEKHALSEDIHTTEFVKDLNSL